jgi:hypothetical protein
MENLTPMASTKRSYINSIAIKDSFRKNEALSRSYRFIRAKINHKTTQATALKITPLNTIDVELDWIQRARENVNFLNANLKYHSILFRVQRSELVGAATD